MLKHISNIQNFQRAAQEASLCFICIKVLVGNEQSRCLWPAENQKKKKNQLGGMTLLQRTYHIADRHERQQEKI